MEDQEAAGLVRRALSGNQTALTELVAVLTPVIQARVARILLTRPSRLPGGRNVRQEVEDLTQEIFLALFDRDARVLRSWQSERGLSLQNFVGLVSERQVISLLRSGRRNPWREDLVPATALDGPSLDCGPEEATASREELSLLLDRLRQELTPLGQRIFDLVYVQELALPEVMAATGLTADAVYAWRSRLRRLAQRLLAEVSGSAGPARRPRKDATG